MPGLRSPLLPLGISGYEPVVAVPRPAFFSPLFPLGLAGYTAPAMVPAPGFQSLLGFWAGGGRGYPAPPAEPDTAVWRPIYRSGTRRR